jgi:hypothetical protein
MIYGSEVYFHTKKITTKKDLIICGLIFSGWWQRWMDILERQRLYEDGGRRLECPIPLSTLYKRAFAEILFRSSSLQVFCGRARIFVASQNLLPHVADQSPAGAGRCKGTMEKEEDGQYGIKCTWGTFMGECLKTFDGGLVHAGFCGMSRFRSSCIQVF